MEGEERGGCLATGVAALLLLFAPPLAAAIGVMAGDRGVNEDEDVEVGVSACPAPICACCRPDELPLPLEGDSRPAACADAGVLNVLVGARLGEECMGACC